MTDDDLTADEVADALAERAQHPWRARVDKSDRARHAGRRGEINRPMAEWVRAECGHRLARLYLAPDGWHFIGEDWRVRPTEWLRRRGMVTDDGEAVTDWNGVPLTLDARDAGRITFNDLRKVRGVAETFPLDIGEEWPTPYRLPVGCDHAHGHLFIEDVMDAARSARDRRAPLPAKRRVVLDK